METTDRKTQHSLEPWTWIPEETDTDWDGSEFISSPAELRDANGKSVFTVDMDEYLGLSSENARRIAACVNACEGIPTEALEEGVVRELVEALEALVVELEWEIGEEKWGRDPDALPMARAVLAKVWGEAS